MRLVTASSPGHLGRANEDFVGGSESASAVVLLDGAGITGTETICRHGVAWYSHTLGSTLRGRLEREGGTDLATALAESIDEVAGLHRPTCDLANPSSPQATVAILRFDGARADFLVLADVYVALDMIADRPRIVTDAREVSVRGECVAALDGIPVGTPEYERTRHAVVDAFRARRNQAGGYWIAKDDPEAAMAAVTGSVPLARLKGAALLSNGASRTWIPTDLRTGPPSWSCCARADPRRCSDESARQSRGPLARCREPPSPTTRRWSTARRDRGHP